MRLFPNLFSCCFCFLFRVLEERLDCRDFVASREIGYVRFRNAEKLIITAKSPRIKILNNLDIISVSNTRLDNVWAKSYSVVSSQKRILDDASSEYYYHYFPRDEQERTERKVSSKKHSTTPVILKIWIPTA